MCNSHSVPEDDGDSPQRTAQQMLSASQLQSLAHGLFPPDEGTMVTVCHSGELEETARTIEGSLNNALEHAKYPMAPYEVDIPCIYEIGFWLPLHTPTIGGYNCVLRKKTWTCQDDFIQRWFSVYTRCFPTRK